MTYELRQHPDAPSLDLRACTDSERLIKGGALWDLNVIQANLPVMRIIYSGNAEKDAQNELMWTIDNAKAFISKLYRGRYHGSEWCYTAKGDKPYPADAYVMGFNRHKGEENQKTDPWIYFKFSVLAQTNSILIFSSHLEKKNGK